MQEVMRAWILGLNNCEFSSFMVIISQYITIMTKLPIRSQQSKQHKIVKLW